MGIDCDLHKEFEYDCECGVELEYNEVGFTFYSKIKPNTQELIISNSSNIIHEDGFFKLLEYDLECINNLVKLDKEESFGEEVTTFLSRCLELLEEQHIIYISIG